MPVITVLGIHTPALDLNSLRLNIRRAAASIVPLKITEDEVSVFFPEDMNGIPHGEEVIAKIEGLFNKPERTDQVRQELAGKVADAIRDFALEHLKQCRLIEVFVHEFNPARGFATIEITAEDREAQSD